MSVATHAIDGTAVPISLFGGLSKIGVDMTWSPDRHFQNDPPATFLTFSLTVLMNGFDGDVADELDHLSERLVRDR